MTPLAALAAGPPPLTAVRMLTAWRAEPGAVAAVVVLGGGYGAGVARLRRAGQTWPRSRAACFAGGVAVLAIACLSFVGTYDDTLFWARALQNTLLLMVVPLLLAMGSPLRLVAANLSQRWRGRAGRILHSRAARLLSAPPVVTVLLVGPLLVVYLSPLYEVTLRNAVVSGAVSTTLVVAGFAYFWIRLRLDPVPRKDPYGLTIAITVVEVIGDAALGLVVWLGPLIAAGYYLALARDWGPDLRTDQVIGAGVLWIGGDLAGLPFLGIVFARMTREDDRDAVEVDRALDAVETTEQATSDDGPPRLWWEDHPELSQRFRRLPGG